VASGDSNLAITNSAAAETNRLISPKQFDVFSLPYLQRINSRVIELDVKSFFIYICGEQNKNLKSWQQVPMTHQTIVNVGREISLSTAMEAFPRMHRRGQVSLWMVYPHGGLRRPLRLRQ
jgi:uroporphyrinogen-III decarboxylase